MTLNPNHLFYIIFIFFVFGLSFNSYLDFNKHSEDKKMSPYWFWSLIFLQISNICAFIMPFGVNYLAIPFNTFLVASLISLNILIRSWNEAITKNIVNISCLFIGIFFFLFLYIFLNYTFIERLFIAAFTLSTMLAWQLFELLRLIKKDKSIHLKFIAGLALISIFVCQIRFIITLHSSSPDAKTTFIYNESQPGQLLRLIFSCSLLLVYVFISNYFYQRLLNTEKRALQKIKNKDKQLNLSYKEKLNLSKILKEREEMLVKLLASNKLSSTNALSASIAHELNQPLGAIQINSQHLEMRLKQEVAEKPELKKLIGQILEDNKRASGIVKTLRNLFSENKIDYINSDINLILEKLQPLLTPIASKNNIDLKFVLKSKALVRINQNEINQVILNLFNNAIDATKLITRKKVIKITTQDKQNQVLVSVEDNGIGVDKTIQKSIFNLLKSNKKDGAGIGLWLSHYIIEKSHGKISFKNLTKNGARFTIQLPAIKSM